MENEILCDRKVLEDSVMKLDVAQSHLSIT